jgi:hypothetical protein
MYVNYRDIHDLKNSENASLHVVGDDVKFLTREMLEKLLEIGKTDTVFHQLYFSHIYAIDSEDEYFPGHSTVYGYKECEQVVEQLKIVRIWKPADGRFMSIECNSHETAVVLWMLLNNVSIKSFCKGFRWHYEQRKLLTTWMEEYVKTKLDLKSLDSVVSLFKVSWQMPKAVREQIKQKRNANKQ